MGYQAGVRWPHVQITLLTWWKHVTYFSVYLYIG